MTTKAKAIAVAKKFGFEIDPSVTGRFGDTHMVTLDHPTHSIGPDCRSIHEQDHVASRMWAEVIKRLREEGPLLEPCSTPDCDYHQSDD